MADSKSPTVGWQRIGAPCLIRIYGVEFRLLSGVIVSLKPLVARVTDGDKVWHNCEVTSHQARIRRAEL